MHQHKRPVSPARFTLPLAALFACTFTPLAAHAGGIDAIATGSFVSLYSPDSQGGLDRYASGGGVSIIFLEPSEEVSIGGELQASFMSGADGRRLYNLGASFIVSYTIKDELAAPFMRLGLDLAAAAAEDIDQSRARGIMAGVHGAAGLHGYFGKDKLYWRAELGFLGAGPGGVQTQISLGYNFGEF